MESIDQPWHFLEINEVFKNLKSSEKGLNKQEAQRRLKQFGPNSLNASPPYHTLRIFFRQLHNPIIYVLLLSTALALILGKTSDSLVVFSVVVLNTLIGFIQEYRAEKTIQSLNSIVPDQTCVLRNGISTMIPSTHLVPGDVVVLQAGDRVGADLRLISVKNLECDESTLTGESLPVLKRTDTHPIETITAEKKCMAFNGTYVTAGVGQGVVVATGLKTEFGKISELVQQAVSLETPMTLTLQKIAKGITAGVILVSLSLCLVGYLRGSTLYEAVFSAITLAVAAIPEGLPAIITIASSIGVRRMAVKQAIIRQLPAVEALGSTSIICTDKTGTLTYNEMTVQKIWTPSGFSFLSGAGYSLEGQIQLEQGVDTTELHKILTGAILCSDASIEEGPNGWMPIGDPTEIALVVAGRKMGLREQETRLQWKRLDVIPFESEKRWMATLNQSAEGESCIFVKGAPEEIVKICAIPNPIGQPLSKADAMAKEGMRILAIASKSAPPQRLLIDEGEIKTGFTLLGFIGMIDPPRKEVYQALKSCHEAGINVKMVTGDHPLTAAAIARNLSLLGSGKVVSGSEVARLDASGWKEIAEKTQVFARVAPEDKLKLVQALQELGHVVAMTGDGVNDAAALKRADIGIAMGIKGTAVAKEASDMILADDNFASIEAAVEEGRRVYDNLIKSLAFVLSTSIGQALIVFLSVLFFPINQGEFLHPLSPIQILWINLVVAVGLSLPLAFEPPRPRIMEAPPRKKNLPVLSRSLMLQMGLVSAFMAIGSISLFLWEYYKEISAGIASDIAIAEAQTMAVTAMMLFQLLYLFYCRTITAEAPLPGSDAHSPSGRLSNLRLSISTNPHLLTGIGTVLFAQAIFIYLPAMNTIFGSSPLDAESLLFSIAASCLIIPCLMKGKSQFK